MQLLPHAPGFTLAADAFIGPRELVGFSVARHQRNVFPHYHEFFEFGLVMSGTGIHTTATDEQHVGRGTAVFIAPGVGHGYRACDDLVVYNCFLRSEAARFDLAWASRDDRLGDLFAAPGLEPRPPIVASLAEDALTSCLDHLDAIRGRALGDRGEAHDLGHLLLALDLLARSLAPGGADRTLVDHRVPFVVASAIELFDQDLRQHWTLDELSSRLSVGTYHLERLFRRWVGLPPIAYANRRRAERAATLLSTTDDAIAAIGAHVGWPEPAHFSRRFRQAFGTSPRSYRAQGRELHGPGPDRP